MVAFYIGLGILAFVLLILTRRLRINFRKDEGFILRLRFLFIRLDFKNLFQKKGAPLPKSIYGRLIKSAIGIIEKSHITINSLTLPRVEGDFNTSTFIRPYGYYSLISTLLAILAERAKRLTVKEGSVILIQTESPTLNFDVSVSSRLYALIFYLVPFLSELKRTRKRKKEIKDVGN